MKIKQKNNQTNKFTGDNAIMNNMRSIAEGQSRRLSVQMNQQEILYLIAMTQKKTLFI